METSKKQKGTNRLELRRNIGISIGGLIALSLLFFLVGPNNESYHAKGPMNIGHESLSCTDCHKDTIGTFRQQIQAKVRHWVGLRSSDIHIGHQSITNQVCLDCHARPNEQHPIYRFNEPRFLEARKKIGPQNCVSCHRDHTGQKVNGVEIGFCKECHQETQFKKETLDISHDSLIKTKQWETCLGCHDYHGNHNHPIPKKVSEAISPETLHKYFNGKIESPFSTTKKYPSKKSISNHLKEKD